MLLLLGLCAVLGCGGMGGAEALCVPRGEVGRAEKQRGAVAHGGAGRRGGTDGRVRGERGRVLRRLNTQLLLGATDWRVCGEDCVHGRKCGTWGPVGLRDLISKDGRDSGFDPQWSRYFCPQSVFSSRSQPPPVFSPTSRIHYTSLRVASAMLTLRPLPSLRVASLSPSLLLLRPSRALAHASRYPGRAEPCPVARSRRRDGARHAESRPIPRLAMSAAPIAAALGATDEKENEPLDPVTDSEKEAPEPPDAPLAADAAEREPRPGRGRANPRSAPRRESPRAQQAGEGTPSLRSNAELMAEGGKDAGSGGGVGGGGGRRKTGASVGVDYGGRRTGVAVSYSGFAPRPITVVESADRSLIARLASSFFPVYPVSTLPPHSPLPRLPHPLFPLSLVSPLSPFSPLSPLPPIFPRSPISHLSPPSPRAQGADELVVASPQPSAFPPPLPSLPPLSTSPSPPGGGRTGGGVASVVGSIRGPTGRHVSAVRAITG
ncbi:unnamed protein product [Closterium sp. NIES-53]